MKKNQDKYGNPTRCSPKELCVLLAWASGSGIKLEAASETEIAIEHPKSDWDYQFDVNSAKERLKANMIMLNWINSVFPKNLEDCDWP